MTEREHFIPQFYLKGFTNPEEKLQVYDLKKHKYLEIKQNNICFQKNLYETEWKDANPLLGKYINQNEIEKIFCKYEGEFAKLLKKIRRICTPAQRKGALILNSEEKNLLVRFVVNLIIRNPYNMKSLLDNTPPAEWAPLQNLFDALDFGSSASMYLAANKKIMLTEEVEGNFPQQCIDDLKRRNFMFLYAKDGEFITGDIPVCIADDCDVIGEDKITFYLALTPKIVVLFGNYEGSSKLRNRMVILDNSKVDFFNNQFANYENGKMFLIGSSKEIIQKFVSN